MESNMFCYQCQETAGCTGCTRVGVCGKQPEVAALQDLLVYVTKGMSAVTTQLRAEGTPVDPETNHWVTLNLFLTITNANFDGPALRARVQDTLDRKAVLLAQVQDPSCLPEAAHWTGPQAVFADKAARVGVLSTQDEDVRSLRELITYGLKGLAAYTKHANALGQEDPDLDAFLQRALAATLDHRLTQEELVALALETGQYGVTGMALLDRANTTAYGHPEITKVSLGVGTRPGILVSGHDLRDLEMLLEQTQGTGVDVYTHSEMLPAHAYPAFRKYPNFIGNYGNAWWQQKEEFEAFQGPILMTTNCIVPPKDSYKDRLYTTGAMRREHLLHGGGFGAFRQFDQLIERVGHAVGVEPVFHAEFEAVFVGFVLLLLRELCIGEGRYDFAQLRFAQPGQSAAFGGSGGIAGCGCEIGVFHGVFRVGMHDVPDFVADDGHQFVVVHQIH